MGQRRLRVLPYAVLCLLVVVCRVSASECSQYNQDCIGCLSKPKCAFKDDLLETGGAECLGTKTMEYTELVDSNGNLLLADQLPVLNLRPAEACHMLENNRLIAEQFTKPVSGDFIEQFEWPLVQKALYDEIIRLSSVDVRRVLKEIIEKRPDTPAEQAVERERVLDNVLFRQWRHAPLYVASFFGRYSMVLRGLGLSGVTVNRLLSSQNWNKYWYRPDGKILDSRHSPYFVVINNHITQLEKTWKHAILGMDPEDVPSGYRVPRTLPGETTRNLYTDMAEKAVEQQVKPSASKVCCLRNPVPVSGAYTAVKSRSTKTFSKWMCEVQHENLCAQQVSDTTCGGAISIMNEVPGKRVFVCGDPPELHTAVGVDKGPRDCIRLYEGIVMNSLKWNELAEDQGLSDALFTCQYDIRNVGGRFHRKGVIMGYPIELAYESGRLEAAEAILEIIRKRGEVTANKSGMRSKSTQEYTAAVAAIETAGAYNESRPSAKNAVTIIREITISASK